MITYMLFMLNLALSLFALFFIPFILIGILGMVYEFFKSLGGENE
jgi:hypothetical protein